MTRGDPGTFDALLQGWIDAACMEWNYAAASAANLSGVRERVPAGLQTLIVKGHRQGLIETTGLRFTLRGLPPGKGPYAWVSKSSAGIPTMNWEYLVQSAEYVRVYRQVAPLGYEVLVEDPLMDITVQRNGELLWYIEVKEKADDLLALASRVRSYGSDGVDIPQSERGNDALQKAKYLVQYRPRYLTLSAIGMNLHFQVIYQSSSAFSLVPDVVPLP